MRLNKAAVAEYVDAQMCRVARIISADLLSRSTKVVLPWHPNVWQLRKVVCVVEIHARNFFFKSYQGHYGSLAQLAEHLTLNQFNVGSNPTGAFGMWQGHSTVCAAS